MLSTKKINQIVKKIAAKYNPQFIYLFGSYAKGNATESSDIDLLIVDEKAGKKSTLEVDISLDLFPRDYHLDLVTYSPDAFASNIKSNNPLVSDVLRYGKKLYERK